MGRPAENLLARGLDLLLSLTRLPAGIACACARNDEPPVVAVPDALGDPRLVDLEWARERGIRSLCGFPLRFYDRLVGVLSLGLASPLPTAHRSLLETYSDHAALALGQADLRRQLET